MKGRAFFISQSPASGCALCHIRSKATEVGPRPLPPWRDSWFGPVPCWPCMISIIRARETCLAGQGWLDRRGHLPPAPRPGLVILAARARSLRQQWRNALSLHLARHGADRNPVCTCSTWPRPAPCASSSPTTRSGAASPHGWNRSRSTAPAPSRPGQRLITPFIRRKPGRGKALLARRPDTRCHAGPSGRRPAHWRARSRLRI